MPTFQTWSEIYLHYGGSISLAEWLPLIGTGTSSSPFDIYEYLERQVGHPLDRNEIRLKRVARYAELVIEQPIMPGVEEYLLEAQRLGLKLGVASSSSRQWVVGNLSRLGLVDYFETIVCSDDVARTKPDPELYLSAITRLNVEAHEALALEDSPNGSFAAKSAGLYCVAVPGPLTNQLNFDHVDLRVNSLTDMPLEKLLAHFNNLVK